MRNNILTYFIERESGLKRYVFDFILFTLGVRGRQIGSISKKDRIDIYYGNNCSYSESCNLIILENSSDILWKPLLEGRCTLQNIDKVIEFDIINAISLLITDKVNQGLPRECYDQHDRLLFEYSFQAKSKIGDIPVVNVYVLLLKALIEQKCFLKTIPLWPKSKKCAIGLSHDVDLPDKYALLKTPLIFKNLNLRHNINRNLLKIKQMINRIIDTNPNNFWLFKDVMQAEERLGFRSSFYFAAVNFYHEYGTNWDVNYDIMNQEFATIFDEILERGFEIGLHASYNAYLNEHHLTYEKQKIEHIINQKIKGLRHHYWHMGKNELRTLRMHKTAGFEYDSSIAFNESLGFRRNIALPYNPWDEDNDCMLSIIQLPVFCMDGNLFYKPIEVNAAVEKLKEYIDTIKKFGGIGVIDWHVRTAYPKNEEYFNWGKAYTKLIEQLSNDGEIWVTNPGNISGWLKNRSQDLQ